MKIFISLLLFFYFLSNIDCQKNIDLLRKEIDKIISFDTEIDFKATSGFIVGVIDGDSEMVLGFGEFENQHDETPVEDKIFELGSVSKVFTASLMSYLAEIQLLSLNDFINNSIAIEFQNPNLKNITLKDLLSHEASFPTYPTNFGKYSTKTEQPYDCYNKDQLLNFYKNYIPNNTFGKYRYGHTNYALLGLFLEEKFNKSFEQLIREYLFEPLNMKHSFYEITDVNMKKIVQGMRKDGRIAQFRKTGVFKAADGLKSSTSDLLKFLKVHLSLVTSEYYSAFQKSHEITGPTNFNNRIFTTMGWQCYNHSDDFQILSHSGHTNGHHAFIAMVMSTSTAVILLTNSADGSKDLGMLILRMINNNWNR